MFKAIIVALLLAAPAWSVQVVRGEGFVLRSGVDENARGIISEEFTAAFAAPIARATGIPAGPSMPSADIRRIPRMSTIWTENG